MFKTTKQALHEEPIARVNYSDYVPIVEERRNQKNDSDVNFAHRVDLKQAGSFKSNERTRGFSKKRHSGTEKD
jgi:hypothetical protein